MLTKANVNDDQKCTYEGKKIQVKLNSSDFKIQVKFRILFSFIKD